MTSFLETSNAPDEWKFKLRMTEFNCDQKPRKKQRGESINTSFGETYERKYANGTRIHTDNGKM
jgi:hypothetical protein